MAKRIILLFTLLALVVTAGLNAQEEAEAPEAEASSYKDNLKLYQTQKNQWEIGLHGGSFFLTSDVDPSFGWGAGLHIRKAIDYAFSLRFDFLYGVAQGQDGDQGYVPVGSSLEALGYDNTGKAPWYANFENNYMSFNLNGILSLNSFNYKNSQKRWNPYFLAGLGVDIADVTWDATDGTDRYDFATVAAGLDPSASKDDRSTLKDNIDGIVDGDHETDINYASPSEKDRKLNVHANAGVGLSIKVSPKFNIGIEHQVGVGLGKENDLLDGTKFDGIVPLGPGGEGGVFSNTNNPDITQYTSIRLNFNVGNTKNGDRSEPLYWVSPLDLLADDLAATAERVDKSLRDSDNDGVFDMFDQEGETPEGAAVDTRGVTLDSDRDGVADYKDKEPHSPPGYEVDADGIAQIPDPGYTTEEDVNRIVDAKLAEFRNSLPIPDVNSWFLPMINFAFDNFTVRQSEYGKMHQVASVLEDNPNIRLKVIGHADRPASDCYNQVLSYNRSESAINYLVANYNIDRSRLLLRYAGEENPIINTSGASLMNRRVEFRVAVEGDTGDSPMPDCGVKKAGRGNKSYSGEKQGF